jgi:hypothetical protein
VVRLGSAIRVRSLIELARKFASLLLFYMHRLVVGCSLDRYSALLTAVAGIVGVVLAFFLLTTLVMHLALALRNRGQVVVFVARVGYGATFLTSCYAQIRQFQRRLESVIDT